MVRVGGGEIFDELLTAVSFTWNNNVENQQKYHVVSGAAGTVSAAGGWLGSGGLSGNNGMRLYGVGVDQVLHVEMVLPSGVHVRFGPTKWSQEAGKMYHVTTDVTGYCNMGDLADESSWDWQMCSDHGMHFDKLWYAVRGGGGGTYGVVTAVYYQLHKLPGSIQTTTVHLSLLLGNIGDDNIAVQTIVTSGWVEFILKFFFAPQLVGVAESVSNSCSSPGNGGFKGGFFVCFDGAADVMRTAWRKYLDDKFTDDSLRELWNTDEVLDGYFVVEENDSWADYLLSTYPGIFPGIPDIPIPAVYSDFGTLCDEEVGCWYTGQYLMFPIEAIVTKMDKLAEMITYCTYVDFVIPGVLDSCDGGAMYIMGGMIPSADDGMNSLSVHRRKGGFQMVVLTPVARTQFQQLFYGVSDGEVVTGDSFPGALDHNHASADFPTPLKDDWTKACDMRWSEEEREEKCLSFQETAWGTDILKELEKIHEHVDPHHLFQCWDCVDYPKNDEKASLEEKDSKDETSSSSHKKSKAGWTLLLAALMFSVCH